MEADALLQDGEEIQAELVDAFARGDIAGAEGPVVHIDTHLNHVFLVGDRAFKLKRAVRLPFVDFRSVHKRRAACEAELAVNRALGSPFYLGVLPVGLGPDGRYRIGLEGETTDWIVEMRRFDSASQFDVLAKEGALSVELVEAAAAQIAAMHARAPTTPLMGHTADYRHTLRFLERTETEAAARLGLQTGQPSPYDLLDRELAHIGAQIERRRAAGKVRRTHGDLHLRNICLFEGKPVPFDALEFDKRMATTDVLYDLAFFLMDLRHCDLLRQANAAMNRYWDEAREDEEALELLPFFMSLRATVRMAVAVAAGKLEEAQGYRNLAFELLERNGADHIAIGGLSGAGKSAVARELAPRLAGPVGARILRSDVLRKRALGMSLDERAGDDVYAPERRAEVYRELAFRLGAASRAGASAIADATFCLASTRGAMAAAAPDIHGYWLEAPLHVRISRIAGRHNDASDADAEIAMKQEEPADLGPGWRKIDARGSVREIVCEILKDRS
jgi:aminoglycoside phosphotransferase family enzyme/predicted kinase